MIDSIGGLAGSGGVTGHRCSTELAQIHFGFYPNGERNSTVNRPLKETLCNTCELPVMTLGSMVSGSLLEKREKLPMTHAKASFLSF